MSKNVNAVLKNKDKESGINTFLVWNDNVLTSYLVNWRQSLRKFYFKIVDALVLFRVYTVHTNI